MNSSLACPACKVWVDDDRAAKGVQQKWDLSGCGQKVHICPAIACIAPGHAYCGPDPAAPTSINGICTAALATATPL